MKNLNIILIIVNLFLIGCASMPRGEEEKTKLIRLKEQKESTRVTVHNKIVKISFNTDDIKKLLKEVHSPESLKLLEYINSEAAPVIEIPQNNLQIKNDYQEALFPLIKELLLAGQAEVIDVKDNIEVDEIVFISLSGLNGKQVSFKFKGGDIFYTKILTLGE